MMATTVPCISIRQPWASLIFIDSPFRKDVENRSWRAPARIIGQSVLIHASKACSFGDATIAQDYARRILPRQDQTAFGFMEKPRGGIVGMVTVVDCMRDSASPWAIPGQWHWILADARPLPFFTCKGRLGIFKVEYPGVTI